MVLAAQAVKIAARGPDRVGQAPGEEMVEGLFFHRIQVDRPGIAVVEGVQSAFPELSDLAEAPPAFGNPTFPRAEKT